MTANTQESSTIVGPKDILLRLCDSVSFVLSQATASTINQTPMIQKIGHTCLRPDVGTFVLFTGSFDGLVVINFPKEAALEIYGGYLKSMMVPEEEITKNYASDEVANTLGELMNQILGNFTRNLSESLHCRIQQSQPKMLSLPHEVKIGIDMTLDEPVTQRVTFLTQNNNVFYLELAMDDTKFCILQDGADEEKVSPDDILASFTGDIS